MPGWENFSFGYHGDDGGLFINSGTKVESIEEDGSDRTYGAGDTIGAGLDLKTGLGYFTKNGKRIHVGK